MGLIVGFETEGAFVVALEVGIGDVRCGKEEVLVSWLLGFVRVLWGYGIGMERGTTIIDS